MDHKTNQLVIKQITSLVIKRKKVAKRKKRVEERHAINSQRLSLWASCWQAKLPKV